ncbi:MAG: signal peptidase II [Gammaproteobacteria bacterium]|nr:signal peptidase II [Gammaproteobacteria bacterium]
MGKWVWISGLVVVLDQITKVIAVSALLGRPPVVVIPELFDFSLVYNSGAAFGFLSGAGGWQNMFFVVVAAVVSIVIVAMLRRLEPSERQSALAFALILGGALGNLIDRIRFGYVIDFVHWFYRDWHWPHFNVADSAITVGVVLLLLDAFGLRVFGRRTSADNKHP